MPDFRKTSAIVAIAFAILTVTATVDAQRGQPPPIPFWDQTYTVPNGDTYTTRMIGQPPSTPATTNVSVALIPIELVYKDQFGNTIADLNPNAPSCRTGISPRNAILQSPLFQPYDFYAANDPSQPFLGRTQFADAYQRANFWNAGLSPDYHVLFSPIDIMPLQTFDVTPANGFVSFGTGCSPIGRISDSFMEGNEGLINRVNANLGPTLPPNTIPIFLTFNTAITGINSTVTLGRHFRGGIDAPYLVGAFATFIDDYRDFPPELGIPEVEEDVYVLSHELLEMLVTPFPSVRTPPWRGRIGRGDELEVADPLIGSGFLAPVNGFNYHLTDGAFASWFYREVPSKAVNGWYTFMNAFPSPSQASKWDILMRDANGSAGQWFMNGPVIASGGLIGSTNGAEIVATGDLDGDGATDILLRDSIGGLGAWLMSGTSISAGGFIGSLVTPSASYAVAGVGDFNADGKADILLRENGGDIGMWLMDGTHIASGSFVSSPGRGYNVAAVADFNGDRKSDVLVVDSAGSLGMWLMDGPSIAAGGALGNPGGTFRVVGTGDFDGDRKADILLRNEAGDIRMWLMNGATIVSSLFVESAPDYAVAAVRDFNRDGKADILLRHKTTGDVGMWMMNGAAITSGAYVSALSPSYTIISK